MGKPRRHFSNEIKRQAVEDYVSGRKTVAEYQKKVGEQAMIIDLLKKLRNLTCSQRESELSGLIATMKPSGRRKGGAK